MIYYAKPNNLLEIINTISDNDTIYFEEGIYNNKIKIDKNNVKLIGAGTSNTIIQNKDYSPKIHKDNKEYNTFRTYTLMITGNNVEIHNLTIKNCSTPSSKYGQAVALHVLGNNFKAINCSLLSDQDTLFCGPLPLNLQQKYIGFLPTDELSPNYSNQLFQNCYIEGDVDFIFGAGISIFESCHIHTINKQRVCYIAAPSHNLDQKYGFTFLNCKITASEIKDNIFLARPWRDYGKATFIDCFVEGNIIHKLVFDPWGNTNRDKTARFEIYNLNIDTSTMPKWIKVLNKDESSEYTQENIFR